MNLKSLICILASFSFSCGLSALAFDGSGSLNVQPSTYSAEGAGPSSCSTPVKVGLKTDGSIISKPPLRVAVILEDVNNAIDGGLYGELLFDRDFESGYEAPASSAASAQSGWRVEGDKINFSIATDNPVHSNNPHFARLDVKGGIATMINNGGNAFVNSGFGGIALKKGEPYRLRLKARSTKKIPLELDLTTNHGRKMGSGKITINKSEEWQDYELILTPDDHTPDAELRIIPKNNGVLDLDMVSLFPVNTYNSRENGLRADVATAIAEMNPGYVIFPINVENAANEAGEPLGWKGSVGALEARIHGKSADGAHHTNGFGLFEYLRFCEDIAATPLPVFTVADITPNNHDKILANIIDLIEYANGDSNSQLGKMRTDAGHPSSFRINTIGIMPSTTNNPSLSSAVNGLIAEIKNANPQITVIDLAGPGVTDVSAEGENVGEALKNALRLTSLESDGRNVEMALYSPLLSNRMNGLKKGALIGFSNSDMVTSAAYRVGRIFGENCGDATYNLSLSVDGDNKDDANGKIAAGITKDTKSGDVIVKLVNLLPTEITTEVDLKKLFPGHNGPLNSIRTALTGSPSQDKAIVKTDRVSLDSPFFNIPLAPGSLTVLRIK